jgi:hypothetical protein
VGQVQQADINSLCSRLDKLLSEHPCCQTCAGEGETCSCREAQLESESILNDLQHQGVSREQAYQWRQQQLDNALAELFINGNRGRGMSKVDILFLLKALSNFKGVQPSFTTDTQFYNWVDRVLLAPDDGWQEATIKVGVMPTYRRVAASHATPS